MSEDTSRCTPTARLAEHAHLLNCATFENNNYWSAHWEHAAIYNFGMPRIYRGLLIHERALAAKPTIDFPTRHFPFPVNKTFLFGFSLFPPTCVSPTMYQQLFIPPSCLTGNPKPQSRGTGLRGAQRHSRWHSYPTHVRSQPGRCRFAFSFFLFDFFPCVP